MLLYFSFDQKQQQRMEQKIQTTYHVLDMVNHQMGHERLVMMFQMDKY